MPTGFRRFADGFRVVVFTTDPEIKFPDYMRKKRDHRAILERDDVSQFEALVPHDRGIEFWQWCQATEDVAIKLDVQNEFHCPSCLTRKGQVAWSPPVNKGKANREVIVHCEKCGAFYMVLYKMSDMKGRRRR